jgi:hypothetical protein
MVRKINHGATERTKKHRELQDNRITRFQDIFPHSKFFILHFTFFLLNWTLFFRNLRGKTPVLSHLFVSPHRNRKRDNSINYKGCKLMNDIS